MNEPASSPGLAQGGDHPFPGLRPFGFADHRFFFGRDDQVHALYRLLELSRFIAVVGSSGSGKSSLVRAGLLPFLDKENQEETGKPRRWVTMRPGSTPLRSLAQALAAAGRTQSDTDERAAIAAHADRIATSLRSSSFALSKVVDEIDTLRDGRLILVVDQFEELFRYASTQGKRGDARGRARAEDEAVHFVQLLLSASRTHGRSLAVIVTMRSDFIGDCALFQGLPEAVSSAQFLVPSLTRDQREEVIVRPIQEAGGTIDPELIERILNDVSDELDQLPVLQHLLKRVWEEAGEAGAAASTRRLSLASYEAVGRAEGALSRHAEEVLASLPGLELVAEQTFRSLGEFDRDGRIIRRALPFGQLRAETGASEGDLLEVVTRFRADDCSFLFPSPDAQPAIDDHTGIDVGHEAFLRNWDRISAGESPGTALREPTKGWLRAEKEDGRNYSALLGLTQTAAPDEKVVLPSAQVRDRIDWWHSRPRTRAWAERYGGGFDLVEKLLADSAEALAAEEAKERRDAQESLEAEQSKARNYRRLKTAFAVSAVLLVVAIGALGFALHARTLAVAASAAAEAATARAEGAATKANVAAAAAEEAAARAEESFSIALGSTAQIMESVRRSLDGGELQAKPAKEIVDAGIITLGALEKTGQSRQLTVLRIQLLFAMSDVLFNLNDNSAALDFAERAKASIEIALAESPDDRSLKPLLSLAYTRIGLAHAAMGEKDAAFAALNAGWQIDKRDPLADPINLINIADLNSLDDRQLALEQFREVQRIRADLAALDPSLENRRNLAATHTRIGDLLDRMGHSDGALEALTEGLVITQELLAENPSNRVLKSNLARIYRQIGDIHVEWNKDYLAALEAYQLARDLRVDLANSDANRLQFHQFLALSHGDVGKTLVRLERYDLAIAEYDKAAAVWVSLNAKQPRQSYLGNAKLAKGQVGSIRVKMAKEREGAGDVAGAIRQYRSALNVYAALAEVDPHYQRWLAEIQTALGDLFAGIGNTADAIQAYQAAVGAARKALLDNLSDPALKSLVADAQDKIARLCVGSLAPSCRWVEDAAIR